MTESQPDNEETANNRIDAQIGIYFKTNSQAAASGLNRSRTTPNLLSNNVSNVSDLTSDTLTKTRILRYVANGANSDSDGRSELRCFASSIYKNMQSL